MSAQTAQNTPEKATASASKGAYKAPDPYAIDLDKLDPSKAELFENDAHWDYFRRLRAEDPVH